MVIKKVSAKVRLFVHFSKILQYNIKRIIQLAWGISLYDGQLHSSTNWVWM
jgi:hypothetical protein